MPKKGQKSIEMIKTACKKTGGDAFELYKKEIEQSIQKAIQKIKKEKSQKKYISLSNHPLEEIKGLLTKHLENIFKSPRNIINEIALEIPPDYISTDLATPVFNLVKLLKTNPRVIAENLTDKINKTKSSLIEKAEKANGFVNLILNKKKFYNDILTQINKLDGDYGESDVNPKKVVIIDYSAPNVAKPMSVGHLRSTIIGQALSNIYQATGYTVIGDNYIGDWGTQFGKMIYAYQKWGDERKIQRNPLQELKNLYVHFHEEASKNPEIEDRAREIFKKLEEGDSKLVALWKKFRDLTIKTNEETYKKLGVKFDILSGESYFSDKTKAVIDDCLKKKLCRKDPQSQAIIVDTLSNLPSFLLLKQDGSTLYQTRDLATLKFRVETFQPDVILYVVGSEQELKFKQLFSLAKKLGYLQKTDAQHIGFGLVLNRGKKMSTREGGTIELENLLSEAIRKAEEIVKEKNPKLSPSEIKKISQIIGVGAIIYNDLHQSRSKNIVFDWGKMLNLEGASATYLQYAYVRINSILKKIKKAVSKPKTITFEEKIEFKLAIKLGFFPFVVIQAQQENSPHLIATYLEELAQLFNNFYDKISVIKTADSSLFASRFILIKSVASVIKKGLTLLNISVPEKM